VSEAKVTIRELIGWDLDEYSYRRQALDETELRDRAMHARASAADRAVQTPANPLLTAETSQLQSIFAPMLDRDDLAREYKGSNWTLGVVDLRQVLAFQRRLVFDDSRLPLTVPQQHDWLSLLALALDSKRSTAHRISVSNGSLPGLDICIQSQNPDLQLVLSENDSLPMTLYGGSPFFEVAEFNGRWFLRDGYHRAFHLLRAGIHAMVAVILRATTIQELGATEPYFFSEETLFSPRPPRLVDFLSEELTVTYRRPRLLKTIRIRIEETLEPSTGDYQVTSERPGVYQ
jgi:hypothetical protein